MKRPLFMIILLLCFGQHGYCQINNADSLERALVIHEKQDSIRFAILEGLIKIYLQSDILKAKMRIDESLELSKLLGDKRMEVDAGLHEGNFFLFKGQYDSAQTIYSQCSKLALENHYLEGHGISLKNRGIIALYTGKYQEGIDLTRSALESFKKINDGQNMAASLVNLGILLTRNQQYEEALQHFDIVIDLLDTLQEKHVLKMSTYINIGGINYDLKRYDEALYHFSKALEIAKSNLSPKAEASCLYNIGNIHISMAKYDDALEYLKQAMEIKTQLNESRGMGATSTAIGNTYYHLSQHEKAEPYILEGLSIAKRINSAYDMHKGYSILAKNYFELKNFKLARVNIAKAIDIGNKVGPPNTMKNNYALLAKLDSARGDHKSEIRNYKKYIALKDTLFNEEKNRIHSELLAKFESNLKEKTIYEQELKLIKRENEIKTNQDSYTNKIMISYVVMTLLLLISGAYFIKNLRKSKTLLHTKITSLKNQLSPHFLFNSLNVLSNLIHKNQTDADYFLGELAHLYRYMLDNIDKKTVALKDELAFASSFFEVMKIRFGSSINLTTELPDEVLNNHALPPLALQVLLENAVKHNNISTSNPLNIIIKYLETSSISISNNLDKKPDVQSTHLGLHNLKQLYKLGFDKSVNVIESETSFEVILPIIKIK